MQVAGLVAELDRRFPFSGAGAWDPVGLQIGWPDRPVGSVAVCHEVTPAVVEQAVHGEVGTLVSYHPLLFEPTNRLAAGPGPEGRTLRLVEAGTSVIVIHTAMDAAAPGTGDALLAALGIATGGRWAFDEDESTAIGRWGALDRPVAAAELAGRVRDVLGGSLRVTTARSDIERIAVLPGSGGRYLPAAADIADAVITGDVSHHAAAAAAERGLCVIDAGHAATERPAMEGLYAAVCEAVGDALRFDDDPTPWEV